LRQSLPFQFAVDFPKNSLGNIHPGQYARLPSDKKTGGFELRRYQKSAGYIIWTHIFPYSSCGSFPHNRLPTLWR
jgi:hypothetical protein